MIFCNTRALFTSLLVLTLFIHAGCASKNGLNPEVEEDIRTVQLRRAQQFEQSGAGYKALAVYQALLINYPDDSEILQSSASLAERLGEVSSAEMIYTKLVALQPENIEWRERLAMSQIQLGRLQEAQLTLEQLSVVAPTRWRAWSGLGLLADIAGKYQDALELHNRATLLGKEEPMAYNNLGYSRLMAQHYNEAENAFRKGLEIAPRDERLSNNLLIALAWQGKYEDAIQEGRIIFKEWIVYNNVGYIALQRGDYAAAIKLLQMAMSLSPSYYPTAAENLRRAQIALGKR